MSPSLPRPRSPPRPTTTITIAMSRPALTRGGPRRARRPIRFTKARWRLAGLRAGEAVVDVGCGRGELLVVAQEGARRRVGVEYSPGAVALAARDLHRHRGRGPPRRRAAVPVPDAYADLVTMLDIAEHLAPDELHAA